MTIEQIFEIEPRVKLIVENIARNKNRNIWISYSECKNKCLKYVGYYARKEALQTSESYDNLLKYICDKLGI